MTTRPGQTLPRTVPPRPPPKRQRSIDDGGVGQSGYTAGRPADDPALHQELQATPAPRRAGVDDEYLRDELATDERFVG
jgi:hypothetical protein